MDVVVAVDAVAAAQMVQAKAEAKVRDNLECKEVVARQALINEMSEAACSKTIKVVAVEEVAVFAGAVAVEVDAVVAEECKAKHRPSKILSFLSNLLAKTLLQHKTLG